MQPSVTLCPRGIVPRPLCLCSGTATVSLSTAKNSHCPTDCELLSKTYIFKPYSITIFRHSSVSVQMDGRWSLLQHVTVCIAQAESNSWVFFR